MKGPTLRLGLLTGATLLLALTLDAGTALALDSDTKLDAVFANTGGPNRRCLASGGSRFGIIGFKCRDVSADTNDSRGVALGDVDGDTNLDAVFVNIEGQHNRVCLGDGLQITAFTCSDVSADTNDSLRPPGLFS